MTNASTVLVVISYYNAWPVEPLLALLAQLRDLPAGHPFRVRIVVNQGQPQRLTLPPPWNAAEVLHRENLGYNLGAWECGWRTSPAYDGYLFLQDECCLVQPDWLAPFIRRSAEPGIGLVGESVAADWHMLWGDLERRFATDFWPGHLVDGQPVGRATCYLDFLRRRGIPPGATGEHLQSLILFATRQVLETLGGFPLGYSKGEAIGAEIGLSKKVQALGLELAQVGPSPFTFIEHPQWRHRGQAHLDSGQDRPTSEFQLPGDQGGQHAAPLQ